MSARPAAVLGLATLLLCAGAGLDRLLLRTTASALEETIMDHDSSDSLCLQGEQRNSILQRAYFAPRYFPFPRFRVVLETSPGRCDLVVSSPKAGARQRRRACAAFEAGNMMMPEPFVVRAISSVLAGCSSSMRRRRCRVVDLGGNLGLHAAYAAALGAHVDVVEPAADLADTINQTVIANCWQDRVNVHANAITATEADDGKRVEFKGGWRLDDRGKQRVRPHDVTMLAVQRLLRGRRVDLLKLDIDNSAIEQSIVIELERMVASRQANVRALVMEVSSRPAGRGKELAAALSALQRHGYFVYRLAHHLHSMEQLEPWYVECFGPRTLKYALFVKSLRPAEWEELLQFKRDASRGRSDTASLLLMKDPLDRGAEAHWRSESMDATLPTMWRGGGCGVVAPSR